VSRLGSLQTGLSDLQRTFNWVHLTTENHIKREQTMKISARNILPGKVKAIKKGPVSSDIILEIAPGVEVACSITSASVSSLKLKKGQTAYAIIKASSVMVGVD
jgi:molybdopterin-binding protein